jgi:hypothetical protein
MKRRKLRWRSGTPRATASCSRRHPSTVTPPSRKSPSSTFASSRAALQEWLTGSSSTKCMSSAFQTPVLPMTLPQVSTWATSCGILGQPQATAPYSPFLSWILSRQCRRHIISTSILYLRTRRENLLMRSRPPKSRKSKPQELLKSCSKLFNFIWASPLLYLALTAHLSLEQNQSPMPSNLRK